MIGIQDEHVRLAESVAGLLSVRDARGATRAALEKPAALPPWWAELAGGGWLGLHVPEPAGGSGYGLLEAVIVAEQLGAALAGGPTTPTMAVAAALGTHELVRGLADGSLTAVVADGGFVTGRRVSLPAAAVPDVVAADVLAVLAGEDVVVLRVDSLVVEVGDSLDLVHPAAAVTADAAPADATVVVGAAEAVRLALRLLVAAEAVGGAADCVAATAAYATEREAFGQPIGRFQAVKQHCASMHVVKELATAAVWEAAVAGDRVGLVEASAAVDVALVSALAAYQRCAALTIQIHGGMGFTWEHDAHLHFRRAGALRAWSDPAGAAAPRVARTVGVAGPGVDPRARSLPDDVAAAAAAILALPSDERLPALVDAGLLFPELPAPWGIDADAELQLAVDLTLAGTNRGALLEYMTGWMVPIAVPTIIRHGTPEQQERWLRPTLLDELRWCQLFSEPGAGSDLASLSTKAVRVDGGWRVDGQKVWTSSAVEASVGLALVRTDPTAAKHAGITCVVVHLDAPGVTTRPLRDMTGDHDFNEVFLDDVFVPDADVVGEPGGGWAVARTALSNERSSLASRPESQYDAGAADRAETALGAAGLTELGTLLATERSIAALTQRAVLRLVGGGADAGESAAAKLAGAEHEQAATDFLLRTHGAAALAMAHEHDSPPMRWLRARKVTIAGGTSEILRNVIAERTLGLPRGGT